MLGEVVTERKFAYCFVADYEENSRLWISTGIIFTSRLCTFFLTIATMTGFYSNAIMLIGSGVTVSIFMILLVWMYRLNSKTLVDLRCGICEGKALNTLSVKFQLIESVRVMKLMMLAFCVVGVLIFLGILLLTLTFHVYIADPSKGKVCFALFDLLIAVSAAGGFFAFTLIISDTRRIIRDSAIVQTFFPWLAECLRSSKIRDVTDNHLRASDYYFDQLKLAWEEQEH
ncbi:unnamed protein product [Cylicocyclus nassatus]|uniref:Uncharacterized protein n=1 Tax=Cylicocyclus nassatus TaxID=53992 RepID=A0AA36MDE7_CYLNA|nr:unnamed protein product [Cylicocyclus nassatus]